MPDIRAFLRAIDTFKTPVQVLGSIGAVSAVTPEEANAMYVGPKAKGWSNLSGKFSNLMDRMERAEISDAGAKLKVENLPRNRFDQELLQIPIFGKQKLSLGDILEHPELYEQYPELAQIPVKSTGFNFGLRGAWNPEKGFMHLASGKPENILKTALHEVPHVIQGKEGWAQGANVSMFLPDDFANARKVLNSQLKPLEDTYRKLDTGFNPYSIESAMERKLLGKKLYPHNEDALRRASQYPQFDEYMRLRVRAKELDDAEKFAHSKYTSSSGEQEARDVPERMGMTLEERQRIPPYAYGSGTTVNRLTGEVSGGIPLKDAITKMGVAAPVGAILAEQMAERRWRAEGTAIEEAWNPLESIATGAVGGISGIVGNLIIDPLTEYLTR